MTEAERIQAWEDRAARCSRLLANVERLPQRQDSLTDQLADLRFIATRIGCYDAADFLGREWNLPE